MSYGCSAALQAAIYDRLVADPALSGLVGAEIHDAPPPGPLPPLYVLLGDEVALDRSDKTGAGARHEVTISVIGTGAGFAEAKAAAAAVSDALLRGAPPEMSRGRIAGLWFLRAQARRSGARGLRRIDLRFRARVEDD